MYFFHKIGSTRGLKNLKIRGARGVLFIEDNPLRLDNSAKNARCLLFMLFNIRRKPVSELRLRKILQVPISSVRHL